MNGKRILFLLVLLPIMVLMGKAQPNLAFYSLENQFNSSNFNPAFLTSPEKFTFSIFPIGGISLGYNDQQVIRKLMTKFISGIPSDEDYRELLKSMADRSAFHQNIEIPLFNFTFRSKIGFFNFRIKENEIFTAATQGEVSDFIIKSSIQSTEIEKIQNLPAQAMHYREYSLGYSLPAKNHKFVAGIRAKIYFGKAAFFSGVSGSIYNQSTNYVLKTWGLANISIPEAGIINNNSNVNIVSIFKGSKTTSYLMNSGNPGIGLDLGFKFRIKPDLTFSMSVIDLGKINWKTNLNSRNFTGEYRLHSSSVTSNINGGVETITKKLGNYSISDSISNLFKLTYDRSPFSRSLPVTVYSGLQYQINPSLRISLVDKYVFIQDMNYNNFSITANFDLNKQLSVNTGYAIIGNSYSNIPVALLVRKDFGQIYIGTDNFLSFILPSVSEYAGFTFGTCFYIFRKRGLNKSTSKYFPFYKPRKIRKNQGNGLLIKEYPES